MGSSIELNIMKGDIVESCREIPMRSFTRQFLWLMAKYMIGSSGNDASPIMRAKKMDGTDVTYQTTPTTERATSGMRIFTDADHNYDCNGIVVGSGTTAVDADDYALESRITNGTASGQLSYGLNIDGGYDFTNRKAIFKRRFVNETASNITVSELGVAITNTPDAAAAVSKNYLIIRDVPETAVTIEAGKSLEVVYKVAMPYSTSTGGFNRNFMAAMFAGIFGKRFPCFFAGKGNYDYCLFGTLFSQSGYTVDNQPENVCRANSDYKGGIVATASTSTISYETPSISKINEGYMTSSSPLLHFGNHSWSELKKAGNSIVWEMRRPMSQNGSSAYPAYVKGIGLSFYSGSSMQYMDAMFVPVNVTIKQGETKEIIIRLSTAAG